MTENLLEVKNLKKYFPARGDFLSKAATVKAVDGVDFAIRKGIAFHVSIDTLLHHVIVMNSNDSSAVAYVLRKA